MLPTICIDDKNRPNEVPLTLWVKEGEEYHITKVIKMKQQGGIEGVKLHEINIDGCFPYTYFRLSRFAINLDKLLEMEKNKEVEVEYV